MKNDQRYVSLSSYLSTGKKPLYFLHCLKTAGTSLIHYIVRLHGRDRCDLLYDERQSVPGLLASVSNPIEQLHHRTSHLPLAIMGPFLDQIGHQHFHWMTCVREPMARQLSLYRYLRDRQDRPLLQNLGLDFSSLERFIDGTPRNSQCLFYHPSGQADAALEALDKLDAQVIPLPFLGTVIDALFANQGVAPLAPIHINRSRRDSSDDQISPAVQAMIAERFEQDQLLYDTCYQRVAPLLAGLEPARPTVETLTATDGLERLHSLGGPIHIFGTNTAGQALFRWLNQAGIRVSGFLDSRNQGDILLGRPIQQPEALTAEQMRMATVLIASETYGPVYRLLSDHGGGRIIDAFDLAKTLMLTEVGGCESHHHPPLPINAPRLPDRRPAPPGWPAVPAQPPAGPPAPVPTHRRGEPV
ncbi:hypothetical protein GE253_11280 [Niveispirillum sp. SYP-B3756]|nr:hypothetical protein [Niveispirillum sp. SYP-B3756]